MRYQPYNRGGTRSCCGCFIHQNQTPSAASPLGITALLIGLALALSIAVYAIWHHELSTLMSLEQIRTRDDAHLDGSVYKMEVSGGFYLEEFLEQGGVQSDSELIAFITSHITKGLLDMGISAPEIACSSFTAQTPEGIGSLAGTTTSPRPIPAWSFTEGGGDRHATISTTDLQFLGIGVDADLEGLMDKITCLAAPYTPLDGMNDAGVSCGIYMSYQGRRPWPQIRTPTGPT